MRGPVRPVNRVSLRVAPGQAVGLVGESGSGKSMTAFSIMRLFPTPAARVVEGRVLLQGRDLTPLPEAELRRARGSRMGMVFQDPSAYLKRVSLRVAPGQAVGLVGESGSGKSMTAFSIMRLFPTPAARVVEGRVLLQGRDLTPLPEAELRRVRGSRMGMVFQDPSAYLNPV